METQRYIRYAIIISIIAHSTCLLGFYIANQYFVILGIYISIIYFILLICKGKMPESMMLRTPGMDLDRRIFGPDPVPMFLVYMLTAPVFYSVLALDVLGSAVPFYSMFVLAIIGQIILHFWWKKFASALFILALWLTVLAGALALHAV